MNTCSMETRPLMVGGDFKIIRNPTENNNDRYDGRCTMLSNAYIESLYLREIELSGRKFTWASSASVPTYEKFDRILVSTGWEQKFPLSIMEALTTNISDHMPLHLDIGCPLHMGNNPLFNLNWDGLLEMVFMTW